MFQMAWQSYAQNTLVSLSWPYTTAYISVQGHFGHIILLVWQSKGKINGVYNDIVCNPCPFDSYHRPIKLRDVAHSTAAGEVVQCPGFCSATFPSWVNKPQLIAVCKFNLEARRPPKALPLDTILANRQTLFLLWPFLWLAVARFCWQHIQFSPEPGWKYRRFLFSLEIIAIFEYFWVSVKNTGHCDHTTCLLIALRCVLNTLESFITVVPGYNEVGLHFTSLDMSESVSACLLVCSAKRPINFP